MQQLGFRDQLAIGFVGLPFRGKTLLARKIVRYLCWLGFTSKIFNVGNYRRASYGFQHPPDEIHETVIHEAAMHALTDMVHFLDEKGQVAIYDGQNLTRDKRKNIYKVLKDMNKKISFFWIECICDEEALQREILFQQHNNPDYMNLNEEQIRNDVFARINFSQKEYQNLDLSENVPFVKIFNDGRNFEVFGISGYLPSKVLSYVMNLHIYRRPIYLIRHGQSEFNQVERLGGDPDLSENGKKFANMLESFFEKELPQNPNQKGKNAIKFTNNLGIQIYTSTLKRACQTAEMIKQNLPIMNLKNLDEINAGLCDGLTYSEMEQQYPQEAIARKENKLTYRYPRGESYLDLISRLEPVIYEVERSLAPIIIVAHQAILRCLYAYFNYRDNNEIPYIHIPQHEVIKFIPEAYVCYEQRFIFNIGKNEIEEKVIQNGQVQLVDTLYEL